MLEKHDTYRPPLNYSGRQSTPADVRQHPDLRRTTQSYKRKKRLVKNLWIGSLLIMIPLPPGAQLALALAATFLGLTILDETE
jgi:hypothetical protein